MKKVEFYQRVVELLKEGRRFAVAEIVEMKGSVPQSPEAKMIIFPDRNYEFTIGGGGFEAKVIEDAIALFKGKSQISNSKSQISSKHKIPKFEISKNLQNRLLKTYELTPEDLEMPCGGEVTVAIEVHHPMPKLLIFGGGHIGRMLGRLAGETGLFYITIIDDRQEYADPHRHPGVSRVILTDAKYKKDIPSVGENSFVVLATRSFETDESLVARFANEKLAYLGMIGSENRKKQVFEALKKKGISEKVLKKIHTPIGLPIGGKSPGEVAVSILAELIQVNNQSGSRNL